MKTRKFLWAMLPMMAAALMTTACSSDDDSTSVTPKPAADQTVKSIPYTVTVGQGTTTRASVDGDDITLRFAEGDELYVEGENGKVYGCLTLKSGDADKTTGATFSGDLYYTGIELTDNLQLTATLVGASDELANVKDGKVMGFDNYPTTICTTMAEAVQKYSKLTGTGTYGAKNFSLSQETAFMKFSITLEDGTFGGVEVPVVIKNGNATIGAGKVTTTGRERLFDIKADFVLPVAKGTTIAAGSKLCIANVGNDTEGIIYSSRAMTLAGGLYTIDKTKDFARLWANGPVWRTRNLGATSVTDAGDYYAWGETDGYDTDSHVFSWDTYKYGTLTQLTKYNANDGLKKLVDADDAAYVASNGVWRMALNSEFTALLNSTDLDFIELKGVKGGTCAGRGGSAYEGKIIFLPAAGYRDTALQDYGVGYYWSSERYPDNPEKTHGLYFKSDIGTSELVGSRYNGLSIRAVLK